MVRGVDHTAPARVLPKKESGKVRVPEANTREEAKTWFQEAFDAGKREALLVAELGQSHDACATSSHQGH